MKKSTTLVVLSLIAASALAVTSGDDDEDKEPEELPPPPDDEEETVEEEKELPSVDDPEEPEEPEEPEPEEPWVDPDAPTVPIPTPDPVGESGPSMPAMPANVHQLEMQDDFREWGVLDAVEPDGSVGPKRRVVMLGYDLGWLGRPMAIARVANLARANPNVQFVLFSFQRSRDISGQPTAPLGYVATSIGPDGRARPDAFVGRRKMGGPMSPGQWAELVRWAKNGPLDTQAELRMFDDRYGTPHVVEVRQVNPVAWRWRVWREDYGEESDALATNVRQTKQQAIDAARSYIGNLVGEQSGGGSGVGGIAI